MIEEINEYVKEVRCPAGLAGGPGADGAGRWRRVETDQVSEWFAYPVRLVG
ncbi:MAG TPA: hypothetical protein VGL64_24040 [Amycolatopsis sp.]|jgi:hypothetical protein